VAAGELGYFVNMDLLFATQPECEMEFDSVELNPLEIVIKIMAYLDFHHRLRKVEE